MISEKRKFERFDLALPAKIEVVGQDKSNDQVLNLMTKNICEGGACFFSDQPIFPGTEVRVHLTLPLNGMHMVKERQSLVKATGRVLRSEFGEMAVSFYKGFKLRPLYQPAY